MIDIILPHLAKVKRRGRGYIACCPAHADRSPSLSLREADDGRALVHCHAGCETADVLAAIGLTMADLYPPDGRQRRRPLAPGVTRADVLAALEIERGVSFIIAHDRRAGRQVSATDVAREALARRRIKAAEGVL